MGAESADFFFDCWYLKVITDDGILYVPVRMDPGGIGWDGVNWIHLIQDWDK
jgi:hypothetical protein